MPDLNVGRYFHSSCAFSNKTIFVFCGLENSSGYHGQDVNSIERYDFSQKQKWELISIDESVFPVRSWPGAVQRDEQTILIFGGQQKGRRSDSYIFNINTLEVKQTMDLPKRIDMDQMPSFYDHKSKCIYAVFYHGGEVYKFDKDEKWSICLKF